MMLVPRGREQRLALGNRRIIVLPDQQAAERHFGIERTVRACGSQPANRLRDALRRADLRIESGERDLGFDVALRSEEHTSELQSLMRISYAVFCLKKKQQDTTPSLRQSLVQLKC